MLRRVLKDPVIYFLMAVNIGLAYAYFLNIISAETILFTYYFQSLMLGVSYFLQIMTIHNYSVEDVKFNGVQVEKSAKTKGCIGFFFLIHYGFFHLGYLIFLLINFDFKVDTGFLLPSLTGFALGELIAVIRHNSIIQKEVPNIGTMMFTPYLRIIPMHLFIIAGGFIGFHNPGIFAVFIILKIISDVIMHVIVNKTYKESAKNIEPPIINI